MRLIRYTFWGLIAICLIIVGLANRGEVTLRAMPELIAGIVGVSPDVTLPLYAVIFLGVAAGLLIGFFWEWVREYKHRAEAREKGQEVAQLKREMKRMTTEKHEGKDEVLALLEGTGR